MNTKLNGRLWDVIYYSIKRKHPDWSNKRILVCTRYAYRRRSKYGKTL